MVDPQKFTVIKPLLMSATLELGVCPCAASANYSM